MLALLAALTLIIPAWAIPAHAATTVSAASASVKLVGQTTYTWGSATEAPNAKVWTEVQVGGRWSTSQIGTTSASGGYTLPLTYGASTAGTTTWRVGVSGSDGVSYSKEFTLTRYGISAASAGTKPVGQATNVWGSAPGAAGSSVFTQVKVGGSWSTSQMGTISSSDTYVLPLTYGINTVGTTQWRVGVRTPAGIAYSKEFSLERTGEVFTCRASYYSTGYRTANGERYNPDGLTAAHKTLPFNTMLRVTNKANGRSVDVRINDRGPFVHNRCIDLSRGAMEAIGGISSGVITVDFVKIG